VEDELSDEHGERLERLRAEVESARAALRDVLDFLSDDRHLTDKGIAMREDFLREVQEMQRDLEAVKQEHRLD
jgi:hypothetical protein